LGGAFLPGPTFRAGDPLWVFFPGPPPDGGGGEGGGAKKKTSFRFLGPGGGILVARGGGAHGPKGPPWPPDFRSARRGKRGLWPPPPEKDFFGETTGAAGKATGGGGVLIWFMAGGTPPQGGPGGPGGGPFVWAGRAPGHRGAVGAGVGWKPNPCKKKTQRRDFLGPGAEGRQTGTATKGKVLKPGTNPLASVLEPGGGGGRPQKHRISFFFSPGGPLRGQSQSIFRVGFAQGVGFGGTWPTPGNKGLGGHNPSPAAPAWGRPREGGGLVPPPHRFFFHGPRGPLGHFCSSTHLFFWPETFLWFCEHGEKKGAAFRSGGRAFPFGEAN